MIEAILRGKQWLFRRVGTLALLFLFGGMCVPAGAQAQETGTLTGTVVDQKGDSLPGAQIVVVGTQRGSTTGADGQYTISNAPAGQIQVRASFVGYKSQTKSVNLEAGETVTLRFTLRSDLLQMEEAVVTGSFQERSKMESSVAITTLNSAKIEEQNAQNIADLMKAVPGMWVESSGGAGGNNVFTRGLPANGKLRYIELNYNGLPVFESNGLDFANTDQFFRSDKSVQTMESVRGGTASIFAASAPAGIMNFRSKTGGQELGGTVKIEGGTASNMSPGLLRTDFNVGGPMGEDWRFNIGGFYRYDEGVRHPGFPANRGGQVTANVTRLMDNGYVRVYGRYMNEENAFYLPIPLKNPSDPEGISGFDPNYGTMTNADAARVRVPAPNGVGRVTRDLTRGINPVLQSIQTDLVFDLSDRLTIENKLKAMQTDLTFNAAFSTSAPSDAQAFPASKLPEGESIASYQYDYAYSDRSFNPASANGNGLVSEFGWWHVNKPMTNVIDQFELKYDAEAHSLTGGLYFSTYSLEETWHWHSMLTDVQGNPRMLDLTVTNQSGTTYQVTENGFTQYGTTYAGHQGSGTIVAAYAGDEWQVNDQLRVDLGARLEKNIFRGKADNARTIDDMDGNPNTLYDNGVSVASNSIFTYRDSFTEWALSVGANYSLNEQYAVFGRFSRGFHMPDLDAFRNQADARVETVLQGELGVKINTPNYGAFITAFYSSLTNIPFDDQELNDQGQIVTNTQFANSLTPGVEIELNSQFGDFTGNLTATLQQPEYRDYTYEADTDGDGSLESFDFTDNRVRRQPRYMVSVNPRYDLGVAEVSTTLRFVDERYTSDANSGIVLPSYYVWNASVSTTQGPVTLKLAGNNLTNSLGLTEGNPRTGQQIGQVTNIFQARPILGRRVTLSLQYDF
jgi:outer membrane receptor protein involved in Fe transport